MDQKIMMIGGAVAVVVLILVVLMMLTSAPPGSQCTLIENRCCKGEVCSFNQMLCEPGKIPVCTGCDAECMPICTCRPETADPEKKPGYQDVSPAKAKELIDNTPDLVVIDVSPHYANGHLPGAVHYYLGDGSLDAAIPTLDKSVPYLVYCHVDSVAIAGAQKLVDAGFYPVYRLEGNYGAWVDAGYPIETGAAGCSDNTQCAEGEFCEKATGDCDGTGECEVMPEICTMEYMPVCGCDGQTYGNDCSRRGAGVSKASNGECGGVEIPLVPGEVIV